MNIPYLELGSLKMRLVKMRLCWSTVDVRTGVLVRRGATQTHGGQGQENIKTHMGMMPPQAKNSQQPPAARKRRGRILPRAFREKNFVLPTPWF